MRIRAIAALLVVCALLASCKHSTADKCSVCPAIYQAAPFVKVKIVDKNTGADLFLSPSSPYKFSDLTITSSVDGSNAVVSIDSTQKNDRFIRIITTESQTLKLKLSGLAQDSIIIATKNDLPKCCPVLSISKITLNATVICSPCTFDQLITITK